MAAKCAHCHSINTQALADRYQCLDCGKHSDYEGNKAEPGGAPADIEAAKAKLERGREVAMVGNLADLQVAGGDGTPDTVGEAARLNRPDAPAEEPKKGKK